MNFTRNTFKTTEMHWQQRQDVNVRFENKREIDTMSQVRGEQAA